MIFNPNKPLSKNEILQLAEVDFLEYIDSQSRYLQQFTAPDLPPYHKKLYRTMNDQQTNNTDSVDKASDIVTQATRI